jgi:hypothetical protein
MGLVHPAAAHATDIDFLQGDDVGAAFVDNGRDAGRIEPSVGTEATVDIIGEETYPPLHDRVSD